MIVDSSLIKNINKYIEGLQRDKHFDFSPVNVGITKHGNNLKLGFSCYALKLLFITKKWDQLNSQKQNEWISFINSFQANLLNLPQNSFVDKVFINDYKSFNFNKSAKSLIKKTLNIFDLYSYEKPYKVLENNIRAESKQAIATLFQVNEKNKLDYLDFQQEDEEINKFLNSFNWNKPWHAGAQFSALCVFNKTQLNGTKREKGIGALNNFIESKLDIDTGMYFENTLPSGSESINGSMKVLTGLDWIDTPIHFPEKLIDFCLLNEPSSEGCDLVDAVYVLYRCSKQTNYKRKEINNYFNKLQKIILSHYKSDEGGFSYYINRSQEYYYGLKITDGQNRADIHGTLLLLWALSMIYDFQNEENELFNIIKP